MLTKKHKYFLIFIIIFFSISSLTADDKIEHRISVLVNEEMITSYDIIQRLKLTAFIQGVNINDQNNQFMVNNTVDELIQEKLKLEKINEYKIEADEKEYIEFENSFFNRNGINRDQLKQSLIENNINYQELKKRLLSELLWGKLISALYYRLTSVSELEVEEIRKRNPNISINQANNLVIQRQLDLKSSKLLRDIMNEATIEYR